MKRDGDTTTAARAESYAVLMPLLQALYTEFSELSKKKPDAPVGNSKIVIVNRLLKNCKELLNVEASATYLDMLDADVVPQNSDVILILSQYVAAMKSFHEKYHRYDVSNGTRRWFTD